MTTDQVAELPTGISLAYRTRGEPSAPPVLLTAGLGQDLTAWTDPLIDSLVASGLYVIHYDNRDIGRSSYLDHLTPPGPLRLLLSKPRPDAYRLEDMALDAVGLLDHLGIDRAHLVGQSMGGMIAQTIAAHHPPPPAPPNNQNTTPRPPTIGPHSHPDVHLLHHRPPLSRPAGCLDEAQTRRPHPAPVENPRAIRTPAPRPDRPPRRNRLPLRRHRRASLSRTPLGPPRRQRSHRLGPPGPSHLRLSRPNRRRTPNRRPHPHHQRRPRPHSRPHRRPSHSHRHPPRPAHNNPRHGPPPSPHPHPPHRQTTHRTHPRANRLINGPSGRQVQLPLEQTIGSMTPDSTCTEGHLTLTARGNPSLPGKYCN